MKKTKKAGFQFVGFKVIKSHIEKKGFDKVGTDLELGFKPRGEKDSTKNIFNLYLGILISDKEKQFIVDIEIVGFFKYENIDNDDIRDNYFYINAPAILFPYVRAYVSTLTALSGYETITMPTMNLTLLGDTLKKNIKELHSDIKLELK